ncbi:type I-E CRISPR-associated protein Cas6/Cse3/CasE [Arthrobacter sp.]|uniref:type I-E CRISPR-associated protein Cas6/Cse3/CasE n=1 Tax=Arthrobacter sp. TaxID=1667 RepID=UPI0026DFFEAC|nr:type I-E CRISPR-associated protein Cas6/Cse3/CasE [Arthrobacter sp.]MDO5752437.1 type I-E CRISPR-associated protein Cas6/Cse3/CasE [Arthrobacter sp.]
MTRPPTFLSLIALHTLFSGRNGMPGPKSINDPLALHGSVMRLFGPLGGPSPRAAAGILFRLEPAVPGRAPALLIRSALVPQTTLPGLLTREEPAAPAAGTPVAFRLSANAVRRHGTSVIVDGRKRTRSTMSGSVPRDDDPTNTGPAMTEWVADKVTDAIGAVELLNHDRHVIGNKAGRTVQTDLVDGFGVIEDPEKLAVLLAAGIGRAKNYGCGLLTVKPVY